MTKLRRRLRFPAASAAFLAATYLVGTGAAATSGMPITRADTRSRVILIGLDSADWQILEPLIASGRMPNLQKLREEGCWGRLRTIAPTLSPVLWTTIATGREPADHGILDFVATDSDGKSIPVTSGFRKTSAIWNVATRAGLRTGVVGWWATWPAEPIDGYVVTDKVAYQLFGLGTQTDTALDYRMVWPGSLARDIGGLVLQKKDVPQETVRKYLDIPASWDSDPRVIEDDRERVDLFRGYLAQAESYRRIGLALHRQLRPDLDMVYFESPDEVSHMFMSFRPPLMPGVDEVRAKWFGQAVDRYYEETDRIVGDFVKLAEQENAAIVVCSDHGFKSGADRPNTDSRIGKGAAADWHRKYGIIVCAGGPFASGGVEIQDASVLDIAPTLLAALGLPIASDLDGAVLEGAFAPSFLARYPLRKLASYEDGRHAEVVAASASAPPATQIEQDQLDALAALGYIEPAGESAPDGDKQSGPNYHNNKGTLHLQEGRFADAVREFEAAIALSPDFAGARLNLARAHRAAGDIEKARAVLDELVRKRGADKSVFHELGRVAIEEKRFSQAESYLRKGMDLDPNDVALMNSLAELLEITGRFDEAISLNKRCIEVDPDNEQGYNNIGNIFRKLGRPQEAESWYRKAIAADAEFGGSYNNLGLVLQDQGRFDEAEVELTKALERYGKMVGKTHEYAVVLNSIGTLIFHRSQSDRSMLAKAKAKFQEALQVDPEYPEAHNNLGAVLGIEGYQVQELREYEKAVELEPRYADGLFNLGKTYMRMGGQERALQYLLRVVEVNPRHAMARALAGNLLWQKGELDSALAMFNATLAEKPDFLPALLGKGSILAQRNQHAEAVAVLEEAMRFHPRDRTLLTDLQRAYVAMGEGADAERIKAALDALGTVESSGATKR